MNGRFGRRLLGALALLAMVAGLSARADYIIIQVNLNGEYRPLTSAAGAAAESEAPTSTATRSWSTRQEPSWHAHPSSSRRSSSPT